MKKPFNYALFAIIAILIPITISHAETSTVAGQTTTATTVKPISTKTPASTKEASDEAAEPTATDSLAVRKAKAETNLRAIQVQFTLFATRTQTTIDRLAGKNIDTTKAQAALALSTKALAEAKVNLDLLVPPTVPETTPSNISIDLPSEKVMKTEKTPVVEDTTEIKASLKNIEDNLKDARTHLIESLTLLKTSIALSMNAE